MQNQPDPSSILLIRPSAIGDNVFASSLIPPLRARYPHARIYWLTQPECAALFTGNPRLDGVIEYPHRRLRDLARRRRYLALLREWRQFSSRLRSMQFDLAIDLQGLLKSGLIAWSSRAGRRVGLGSREGSQYLMHEVVPRRLDDTDINAEYRSLAVRLGLPVGEFPMDLAVSDDMDAGTRELMAARGLDGGFIVAVPFTTRPQKHWFEASWSTLIPRLMRETGLPVVVLGGPADAQASRRILDGIGGQAAELALVGDQCIAIGEASALIRHASLVIGVDTGMTHMGIAHRRPTIGIFGSTRPYLSTRTPHTFIHYADLECSPCRRHPTCGGAFTCMREVHPEAVLRTACRLLAASAGGFAGYQ